MPNNAVLYAVTIGWTLGSFFLAAVLIRAMVSSSWNKIANAHPGVDPAPEAVHKNFQSFSMNLMNLGMCVHVAVDESYLHLYPASFIRWFGARQASIPWDSIEDMNKHMLGSRKVKIEGVTVWGPAWCMKLAAS